ncbi:ABC transporter substrate-binding protein [Corynebacterium ammoniagenes]|uniref:Endolytic murein transglycosylase n=2 Tax=Corynebacterium ammoniagenes TaxID=1697 RepID=A0AAV5G6R6_CORAM|nr:ABC transporter substrate-binding protein [Corynebacterium ammoniagenes]
MSHKDPRLAKSMKPVHVKRRQRGLAVLISSFVLIIGAVVYIAIRVISGSGGESDGNDYQGDGNGTVELVQIPEGSSISQLGPELEQRDIVKSDGAFQAAAASNMDAGNIQPGFYRLQGQMSASSAVEALLNEENRVDMLEVQGGSTLMDINVLGGDTRYGIYSLIEAVTCNDGQCVKKEELENTAATVDPAQLGAPEWALDDIRARGDDPKRIEGLIAPGQYVLDPHMNAEEILTDLITRSTERYNETGIEDRARAIGITPYELLTSASLVEREAPAGEFDKVARVILNRLDEPMRLEFDSTVNYGLEDVELATTDEDREKVTPWNTYAMDGLPETPIASPSEEAITAMENPAEGEWLFFVTIDDQGTTVFTNTFEEHLEQVDRAIDSGILDTQRP